MQNWNTALERAGSWFLHSGIQESGGGVARYYRSDLGQNAPVSTEITGYAVSFLVYLYKRGGEQQYLDGAVRAARFLTRCAWDAESGLFSFELSRDFAYFFDSGIIVRGLLSIWRVTQESEFLDIAVAAGRGMIANFLSAHHTHPIVCLPERHPMAYQSRWAASPGCYQLKSAMAWHDLYEATQETEFWGAYQVSLERALANQAAFLPGSEDTDKVMDRLHAYEYFLEGLLPLARRRDCYEAITDGIERVSGYLREISSTFARSDVYAQLLRLRLFVEALEIDPLDFEAASHEAEEAARFQVDSGGFGFGRKCGRTMPFVNPVSTAFCAQALGMWGDRPDKRLESDSTVVI